ncbi:GntR family transcriptional regulator [Acrocarpospora phusangensis]|uniref:GntR family transcriptional regulator n=1 Tax=Acrocarpospora phusangensis TaxID=1070424 RepID=A0A919ULB8_9ACTN|nr:GntR family transcriptional regulator [Acrocarpospora phusangensis]GIH22158.1 GntR family transcriptional regulator [Acrocarpospora phusangensis]
MTGTALSHLTSETLADQAYAALRLAIANGELAWGEKITERGLATRLAVSPTPIREALRRLEQDRLVERTGPRSLRVVRLSPETLAEIREVEIQLLGLTARFAARNISAEALAKVEAALAEADPLRANLVRIHNAGGNLPPEMVQRLLAALRRFHGIIEEAGANPVLAGLLEQARAFSPAVRVESALAQLAVTGGAYEEHHHLLQALRDRNESQAEEIARRHGLAPSPGA